MNRLIENTVFSGFVTAWRLATWPTRISPSLVKATTDGREAAALLVGDDDGAAPLHHRDDRVRGAEVDADHLAHGVSFLRWPGVRRPASAVSVGAARHVLIGMWRVPGRASTFGNVTVSTPRLTRASARSRSSPGGSGTVLTKPP